MPLIQVQLFEGRSLEVRRELVAALTRETCRVLQCPPEAVDIILTDVKRENWASAGELFSDRKKT